MEETKRNIILEENSFTKNGLRIQTMKLINILNGSMRTLGDRKKPASVFVLQIKGIITWHWIWKATRPQEMLQIQGKMENYRDSYMMEISQAGMEVVDDFEQIAELRMPDVERLVEKCEKFLLKLRDII